MELWILFLLGIVFAALMYFGLLVLRAYIVAKALAEAILAPLAFAMLMGPFAPETRERNNRGK